MSDIRLTSPAALRNREPILAVLREHLPASGLVLEIASGTGEHVAHFAAGLPGLVFQPSDPEPARRASVDSWCEGLANVRPAVALDVRDDPWPVAAADAIFCANMIHIAPWEATPTLLHGAAAVLPAGGVLILYGPYFTDDAPAEGNIAFDADLRRRDPSWGIRRLADVAGVAAAAGFSLLETQAMPANNLCVIFRRG
jgi:SAM-dependent methyltransferase